MIQSVSCSPLDNSELLMTQQKNALKCKGKNLLHGCGVNEGRHPIHVSSGVDSWGRWEKVEWKLRTDTEWWEGAGVNHRENLSWMRIFSLCRHLHMDLSLNMGYAVIHHLININVRFHFSSMFSKHATLELLLSRLHWSEVDLQLLVVPAGDSHASHVSRVGAAPGVPGPVSPGRARTGLGHSQWSPALQWPLQQAPPSESSEEEAQAHSHLGCHGLRAWSSPTRGSRPSKGQVCDP